jgi:hypothetical protein
VAVHTEDVCRLLVGEEVWTVQRSDSLTWVHTPGGIRGYLRVSDVVPQWLAALVGSTSIGCSAVLEPVMPTEVGPRLGRTSVWQVVDDTSGRRELAQFGRHAEADVALFRCAVGRSVEEIAAAYGAGARPAATKGPLGAQQAETDAEAATASQQQVPVPTIGWWAQVRARLAPRD